MSSTYFGTQNEQIEAAMDIEYTSGLAPGATINYYESPTDSQNHATPQGLDDALNQAGTDANTNRQISSSWGGCEASSTSDPFTSTTENILASNSVTGHDYVFSSGDNGSACVPAPTSPCSLTDPQPQYPASSAYATSVGGTTFSANINGSYPGEVAWTYSASNCPTLNNPQPPVGSGGGYSNLFNRPKWQIGTGLAKNGKRGYPDIAADADPNTGAYVCYGQSPPSCNSIGGGTSLASPIWAGMFADVNQYLQQQSQPLLGFIDPTLYSLATHRQTYTYTPFHDITSGKNGQYQASAEWDAVTGWGSADLYILAQDIMWSIVPSPSPGTFASQLNGIAAISSNNVWAVGYKNSNSLIERWNGKKWSVVPSPNPSTSENVLYSVSVVSSNNIWAVGNYDNNTLIEHWNGTTWSVVPNPNLSTSCPGYNVECNMFFGVAALSATDVWAAGEYQDSTGTTYTLTEHYV
jgi:subtilase family serine protease